MNAASIVLFLGFIVAVFVVQFTSFPSPCSCLTTGLFFILHSDTIDVYDATNKLVAFHALLSPGHKAIDVKGVTTVAKKQIDGNQVGGRSSAIVLTVSTRF